MAQQEFEEAGLHHSAAGCQPASRNPCCPCASAPLTAPPHPGPQHQYHLPQSTAGQAVRKRRSTAPSDPHALPPVRPRLPAQRQLFLRQAPPPASASVLVLIPPLPVVPLSFWLPLLPVCCQPFLLLVPFLLLLLLTGSITAQLKKINAGSATNKSAKKLAMVSFMVTFTVPRTQLCHWSSGWRR